MFDPIYKRGCRKVQGARVFVYSVSIPDFKGLPVISEFYRDVSSLVSQRCEGEFADRAAEEYISLRSEDPRSIFRPTVYSLVAEVTYFDGETMFVKLTATLSLRHKGLEKRVIDAHAWSLDDQMLLPPRQAARRLIPTGRLPLMMGDTGFIAENGKYFLCRGGELFPIAEGHRKKHKNPKRKKEQ